jgi:hypothetical protein
MEKTGNRRVDPYLHNHYVRGERALRSDVALYLNRRLRSQGVHDLNTERHREWYQKAADVGLPGAMNSLGRLYHDRIEFIQLI